MRPSDTWRKMTLDPPRWGDREDDMLEYLRFFFVARCNKEKLGFGNWNVPLFALFKMFFKKKPSSCIALLHRSHFTTRVHVQKMCRRQPAERRSIEAHTKNKNQGKTFTMPIGRSSTIPIWLAKQIFDPYLPAANMSGKFLIWSMRNWKVNTLVIWHC